MRKRFNIAKIIAVAWIFFLVFPLVAGSGFAEEKAGTEKQKKWQEVLVFKSVTGVAPTWCGPNAIVVKEVDFLKAMGSASELEYQKAGGIVYIDVVTKKKIWIIRNIETGHPFCSYDGSLIFYYKMAEHWKDSAIWVYDLKSGKKQKIGYANTSFFRNPASPTGKAFALVGIGEKYQRIWETKLLDWHILFFPKESNIGYGGAEWAKDGSYLMLFLITGVQWDSEGGYSVLRGGKDSYAFYDTKGQLIRNVPKPKLQPFHDLKAMGDGMYFFRKDGRLRRLDPWSGKIEDLPLQVVISKGFNFQFDVSMNGEVAYTRNDHEIGLWIDSIYGNKAQEISGKGTHPAFSKTGEYIAFIKDEIDPNEPYNVIRALVVMKQM